MRVQRMRKKEGVLEGASRQCGKQVTVPRGALGVRHGKGSESVFEGSA